MISKISSLLINEGVGYDLPTPSQNPFLDEEALHEATLLNVLYLALSSTVAILFDLRTSMYFDANTENTGVLVLRGVSQITASSRSERSHKFWLVGDCTTLLEDSYVQIQIRDLLWGQSMIIRTETAEFLAGFVEGIGELAAEIEDKQAGAYFDTTQNWESRMSIATFVTPDLQTL